MKPDWLALVVLSLFLVLGCTEAAAPVSQYGVYTRARIMFAAWQELYPTHDMWANKYPEPCRRDLAHLDVKIVRIDLSAYYLKGNKRILGFWKPGGAPYGTIVISSDIDEVTSSHVFHHEACHGLMHVEHGDSGWHR